MAWTSVVMIEVVGSDQIWDTVSRYSCWHLLRVCMHGRALRSGPSGGMVGTINKHEEAWGVGQQWESECCQRREGRG